MHMHYGISSSIEVCIACGPRNLFRKEVNISELQNKRSGSDQTGIEWFKV